MTPQSIRRAAKVLRKHARSLRDSFYDGGWQCLDTFPEVPADHDEMIDLARQLERLARDTPKGIQP
jgi:hypothetical protein